MTKALVLGAYSGASVTLTPVASKFYARIGGKFEKLVQEFGPHKKGKAKIFYELHEEYPIVCVVNIGPQDAQYNELEDIDEKRENIRKSLAVGAKCVRDENNVDEIYFDTCGDGEAAGESAHLSLWSYDELKSQQYKKKVVRIQPYSECDQASKDSFEIGAKLAVAQNICRRLAETPANLMTPTIFSQNALALFKEFPAVKVVVRDQKWAEEKKMGSFLSVSRGSSEPPRFLELHYNNKPDSKPFVMVGKGVCFDSGGISLKPSAGMDEMRADMGGAANVVSAIYALASLKAQVNVIGLTPLCENMPGGSATKPGDVVVAMNGKTIQIDNTDAEGRLILADALHYAHEFQPRGILDIATLTGAMRVALGSAATGVFSRSTKLYEGLRKAGVHTGDRVWRMPLWQCFTDSVTNAQLADLNNIAKCGRNAGACTAAAFLSEFVTCPDWMHLDIAGVMDTKDEHAYLCKGMSGRPCRTLYYFIKDHFKTN